MSGRAVPPDGTRPGARRRSRPAGPGRRSGRSRRWPDRATCEPIPRTRHGRQGEGGPAQLGDAAVARPERPGDPTRRPPEATARARSRPGEPASHVATLPGIGRDIATHRGPGRRRLTVTRAGYGTPPFGWLRLGYTRATIIQPAYSLCTPDQRCTLSSGTSRIAGDRPVPHIVTELPGPKARAHVAFDETWTSPSLPRAYPIVPVRGEGLTVEDIDGNLFLDFAAGIAVNSTGHCPSAGRRGDQGAGGRAHPFLGVGLLPADLSAGLPRARADRADLGPRRAPTSATPGPRSSRPRSSSPASRPSGRTSWRSSAPSTDGPTARSR